MPTPMPAPLSLDFLRSDGTPKGPGFLGPLKHKSGGLSTELSIGVDFGYGAMDIPSLVPGLTPEEINHMLEGNAPTDAIVDKAVTHAMQRLNMGLSPFKEPDEE